MDGVKMIKKALFYTLIFFVGVLLGLSLSLHYVADKITKECNAFIIENYISINKKEFQSDWFNEHFANKTAVDLLIT